MQMEIEPNTREVVAKKLWNIVRIVFFMLKTGISKSKLMVDLHLMVKRGNKLAGKAIDNLLTFHHHHMMKSSSFSCVSNDALNFVSPREYEFSCSNSPAINFIPHKRNKHHNYHHNVRHFAKSHYRYNDATTVAAVQKMLEMLNNEAVVAATAVEASPLVLPGFGKSPMVRQLRITDSPFPLKDEGSDVMVDKKAEEFIKKFYKDLKLQKSKIALESPDPYMWGR